MIIYCIENLVTGRILEFDGCNERDAHYKHIVKDDDESLEHWLMYDHIR